MMLPPDMLLLKPTVSWRSLSHTLQGGSKKVSCCTVSTAYFFEPPCSASCVSNPRV